jgi:hypothetical protein
MVRNNVRLGLFYVMLLFLLPVESEAIDLKILSPRVPHDQIE